MGELEFDQVVAIARGYQESRILLTAVELNLFALLRQSPKTAHDIAEAHAWNEYALAMLLDALTVMGFLEKSRSLYSVPRIDRELFSEDDSRRMMHILKHSAFGWNAWSTLTAQIVGNGELRQAVPISHEVEAMHAMAHPLAPGIAALVRPEMGRSFLDVGGGLGTFTIAFLDRDRSLRATLIEQAEVLPVAQRHLAEVGYTDVQLVASELLKGQWPSSQDLVFISAVLHRHPPSACQVLLAHAYASLNHGGRIVIRDYIMSEDRLIPRTGTLASLHTLVTTDGGRPHSFAELRRWLEAEGFRDVRLVQDGERMNGIMEAFKL